ncbi:MAG: signal peptidase I [Candidatus Sigynarchaeota archaeon]
MAKHKRESLLRVTISCAIIFCSIFSAMMIISSTCSPYVIMSDSMEPVLHIGDVVFVNRDFDPNEVKFGPDGDILVVENYSIFVDNGVPASFYAHLDSKTPIIHRAIDKRVLGEKIYFITKGDNNPYADGCIKYVNWTSSDYSLIELNSSNPVPVPSESIIGIVVAIVPFIGNFKIHATTISIHVFAVLSIILIINLWKKRCRL